MNENIGLTVKDLLKACEEQIELGNGDKVVLLSADDEGNEYHALFFGFTDDPTSLLALSRMGLFHDNNDPTKPVTVTYP